MRTVDLFCGCGGLSLGFLKDNHKIVKAVEFDKNIAESYQKNHPNIDLIVDDIRNVDNNNVFKKLFLIHTQKIPLSYNALWKGDFYMTIVCIKAPKALGKFLSLFTKNKK